MTNRKPTRAARPRPGQNAVQPDKAKGTAALAVPCLYPWCAMGDSNARPLAPEANALSN